MGNVLEAYKGQPDKAGYFRIGDVELSIPPEEILTSRVENSDELTTLRAKYPMVVKTGQARLDVTITWKAILTVSPDGVDYSQWEDLRRILAIFKAAPFVEVENEHVRSLLIQHDGRFDTARMAFGLRQLRIDTIPDVIDGLQATLTMTLFNFSPYTRDFAYRDEDNSETDANLSARFSEYINAWMDENLNGLGEDGTKADWKSIDDGSVGFRWRSYMALPWKTDSNPPNGTSAIPPTPPEGYKFDYATDRSSFYFRDNGISFEGQDFQSNDSGVYANGISITFVNNLAQIPLSNYQYPTYQHVGPGTTMVSIAFLTDSPEADGLGMITSMIDELNSQFLRLRSEFRKVASIHATQAVFVDNSMLNMLGIYSILPKGFNTSTVKESTNIEAALMGIQYENMFEDVDPFRTKNVALAYDSTLTRVATDPKFLESLSPEEQALVKPIMDFYSAKSNRDLTYLQDKISRIDDNTRKAVGSMPTIQMPDGIPAGESILIYQVLDQKVPESVLPVIAGGIAGTVDPSNIGTAIIGTQLALDAFNSKLFSDLYPAINAKRNSPPTFTDYFLLDALATQYSLSLPSGVNRSRISIYDKVKAATPNPIDQLYDWAFTSLVLSDKQFNQALQQIQKSPKFTSQFDNAVQGQGPANDPLNAAHGAYRDLGLRSLNLGVADFNPGFYFVDHGVDLYNKTWDTLNGKPAQPGDFTIKDIYAGGAAINKPQIRNGVVTTPVVAGNVDYDNSFALMTRASVPGYSMATAFPTFKLFLMEDSNDTIFYSYDDFYSYSSVSEIEVIRYKDKPDTALIQLTNLAGLLTHKLFDNSVQGRREFALQNSQILPSSPDGSTINTPGGVDTATGGARDSITGEAFNYTTGKGSVSDQFDFADNPNKEVPLKYYALQTGSKIQIRMGFSNNPDKLWPVFTGQVTQLEEENGIITLMAQSYMLELFDQADEDLKTDGWGFSSIGESLDLNIASPITDLMSGHPVDAIERVLQFRWVPRGKAYSGYALWGTTGESDEVIKDMLKVSTARHFGRWQISQGGDPFVKGFRWEQKLGDLLAAIGVERIGNAIATGNDRSGENILINHLINADGSGKTGSITDLSRPANFERPKIIVPAKYSIPSKDKQPPWVYIKDISRRYPEYNLLVKSYGYPFGADATLVFAHPHDWYYSRLPLLGDQEMSLPDDRRDKPAFQEWWDRIGRVKFTAVAKAYLSNADEVVREIDSEKSYATFYYMLLAIRNAVTNKSSGKIPDDAPLIGGTVLPGFNGDVSRALGILPILQAGFNGQQARNAVDSIRKDVQAYLATVNSGTFLRANANSRVQPVCKYHFIDDKMIINNGMRVNSKIYNTVKVGEENIPVNEFIPSHHRRLLDCNPSIVNPDENVNGAGYETIRTCYAQSFLREEVSKMYYGDIILRGAPEIEPLDILLLTDPATGIVGPVEVECVIHSFNQEMGYITIVKPRALVLTNESATATFLAKLIDSYNTANAQIEGFAEEWRKATTTNKGVAVISESAKVIGIGAIGMFGGPGVVIAMALSLRVIAGAVNFSHKLSPCIVIPVMRYGRPWLGGLEGYRMKDFAALVFDKIEQFSVDEIFPVIESWRTLKQIVNPSLANTTRKPQPTPATLKNLTPSTASHLANLDPRFQEALDRWLLEVKSAGFKGTVTSGFRTQAQQDELIAAARAGRAKYLVAMKHSKHQDGLAADVVFDSIPGKQFAISIANKYNISHPFPVADPVHFVWKG